MADKRLFYVLIAVCLIGASTAKPTDAEEDSASLKQLLAAMRRYLGTKDQQDKAAKAERTNAYEDVRTVYDPSSSQSDVSQAETAGSGYWTEWINVDRNKESGTGEFEDCSRIEYQQDLDHKCYLGCEAPLAVRYSLANQQTTATWTDIENCVGPLNGVTSCGFQCLNVDAYEADKSNCKTSQCATFGLGNECTKCPDVRVQFFCVGQKPSVDKCCPYSTACSRRFNLRSALDSFHTDAERRDVIADILDDVKGVLEPGD